MNTIKNNKVKPKVQYTIRLSEELVDKIKERARRDLRSFNNTIAYLIQQGIEEKKPK